MTQMVTGVQGAGALARVFQNVTTSYKFLFFKAILDALNLTGVLSELKNPIFLKDMYNLFIVNSWYPTVTFKLSFGKDDGIPKLIDNLKEINSNRLSGSDMKYEEFTNVLKEISKKEEVKAIYSRLDRFVKFRFLTPWLENELRGLKDSQKDKKILLLSLEDFQKPQQDQILPYHFIQFDGEEAIQFSDTFVRYLQSNSLIVYDWWRWNFARYLEIKNPLVPGIINKIEKPFKRELTIAKMYWKEILLIDSDLKCLYSNTFLEKYDIDHFIPWSFVTHDKLWNLIPVNPSVNRQKSDRLPDLNSYLEKFLNVQVKSMENFGSKYLVHDFSKEQFVKNTIEEYQFSQSENILLESIKNINKVKTKLQDQIVYLYNVASSQGFASWKYST